MKERKKSANWYIAAAHYLTAGFAIPILIGLVATFIIFPLLSLKSAVLIFWFKSVLSILAIWLGVIYSARYLRKTYIIENKNSIVNLSTTYLVIIGTAYTLFQLFSGKIMGTVIVYNFIWLVVGAILFYIFSKRYLTDTETHI